MEYVIYILKFINFLFCILFIYFIFFIAFHGKGLWHYPASSSLTTTTTTTTPNMTIIGSSNFGYRSVYRDPELNLLIHSTNQSVRDKLHAEKSKLFDNQTTTQVTYETFAITRKLPKWVKLLVSRVLRPYL